MVFRAGDREPESRRMSSNLPPEQAARHESLREGDDFTTRLIDGSPDCLKVLDLDGRLLSMNAGGMKALEICDLAAVLVNRAIGRHLERDELFGSLAASLRGVVRHDRFGIELPIDGE